MTWRQFLVALGLAAGLVGLFGCGMDPPSARQVNGEYIAGNVWTGCYGSTRIFTFSRSIAVIKDDNGCVAGRRIP